MPGPSPPLLLASAPLPELLLLLLLPLLLLLLLKDLLFMPSFLGLALVDFTSFLCCLDSELATPPVLMATGLVLVALTYSIGTMARFAGLSLALS